MATAETNAINAASTGIVGNTGTGFTGTAATQYNVMVGGATSSTLSNIAPSATAGIPLVSGGASANPSFSTAVVAGGGTGATTLTGLVVGNGTSAMTTTTLVTATTFTPVLAFGGGSTGITYSTQYGKYQHVGNCVTFAIFFALSSKGSSTGSATITGLPVTSSNDGGSYSFFLDILDGGAAGSTYFIATLAANASSLSLFYVLSTAGTRTALPDANFNNNSTIKVYGSYFV